MTDSILISVIIPVYNTEQWLADCLDSVLHQECPDMEIICVDDASQDSSPAILRDYSLRDPRIRILTHSVNKGVLEARRTGINSATGKYILFIDSDDAIEPGLCGTVCGLINRSGADLIRFSSRIINCEEDSEYTEDPGEFSLKDSEILSYFFSDRYVSTSIWGMIYRADLLKNAYSRIPVFPHLPGEDVLCTFFTAYYARSFAGFSTDARYIYYLGRGVTSFRYTSPEKFVRYCEMSRYSQIADAFLKEEHAPAEAFTAAENMTARLIADCCHFLQYVPKECREESFSVFWQHWGLNPNLRKGIYRSQTFFGKLIRRQNQTIRSLEETVDRVYNSHSYRLGHLLLAPLRPFRKLIRLVFKK